MIFERKYEIKRWWKKNIFYRPGFPKHRTRFELKHKQYLESAIEIYSANIRTALSASQDISTLPASKYDSAGNIQMISYCKLTMTQLSCQLSHFNISHWILWHLCHSAVTVTPASHSQCRPGARRGDKLWQPHQHRNNRFMEMEILMLGSFTAYSFSVITFVTCPLLWEKGKKVAQNVVSVWSGGRQSVLLIYLVWQFIFLTSILQLIKLWKFGHQNNDDS